MSCGNDQGTSPNKAPSPDGFTIEFYHIAWPIVKNDILVALRSAEQTGVDCME